MPFCRQAFHHGEGRLEDTHRLSLTADPDDTFARVSVAYILSSALRKYGKKLSLFALSLSTCHQVPFYPQERLAGVFVELGAEETEAVPFHLLYQHPIIQDCMHMCQRFKTIVSTMSFVSR